MHEKAGVVREGREGGRGGGEKREKRQGKMNGRSEGMSERMSERWERIKRESQKTARRKGDGENGKGTRSDGKKDKEEQGTMDEREGVERKI